MIGGGFEVVATFFVKVMMQFRYVLNSTKIVPPRNAEGSQFT